MQDTTNVKIVGLSPTASTKTIGKNKENFIMKNFKSNEVRKEHLTNNKLRATRRIKDEEILTKECEDAYVAKIEREEKILAGYKAKKLKSPALIKEAKNIIAERNKKNKRKKDKEQKKEG